MIGFNTLFSSYTQHSVMPQEPFGPILSVMCQRAGRQSLLVHQGPCLADLKSQMRSHSRKKGEPSLSTRKATFPCMQRKTRKSWILVRQEEQEKDLERKGSNSSQLPHISPSHQSQVTRPITFGMRRPDELNGIADAFHHVCWLLHHMVCLLIRLRKHTWWCKNTKRQPVIKT